MPLVNRMKLKLLRINWLTVSSWKMTAHHLTIGEALALQLAEQTLLQQLCALATIVNGNTITNRFIAYSPSNNSAARTPGPLYGST